MIAPLTPDLTVSIISADNLDLLLPCLQSVFESTDRISLEVYVVDNASKDSMVQTVSEAFPSVKLICNAQRLGFSTNNNIVLDKARGRHLLLLNDDTLVLEGALEMMVAFMDEHAEAGAIGSFLLNSDGTYQAAFSRFPNPIIEGILPAAIWSHWFVRSGETPIVVDSVCGAAMMVRREVFEKVGGLDTAFDPIYSEEVDWCYRIRQAGWEIYSLPKARIVHYGSQTMNRIVPQKYALLLSHKLLFFRKHKGAVAASLYRVGLTLSTSIKLIWWSLRRRVQPRKQQVIDKHRLHQYLFKRIPGL